MRGKREPRPHPIPGPLGPALGAIAKPFYGAGVAIRNWMLDRGLGVRRAPVPVISVGNISLGGTGKTPFVVWLVRELAKRGVRCGIAMRGYKAAAMRTLQPPELAGNSRLIGWWSDEVDEFQRALPGVPIVSQPERYEGIRQLLDQTGGAPSVDCIVLDDGFQHRKLARDLDIVLIDATKDCMEEHLFPLGWLREPVSSLKRADVIVLTRFDPRDPAHARLKEQIAALHGREPLTAAPIWAGLQGVPGAELTPVEWLAGKRLLIACGIGNPTAFHRQLKQSAPGATVHSLFYPDHYRFPEKALREIANEARDRDVHAIVTTDKDWSKLRALDPATWPCPIVRPLLVFDVRGSDELLATAMTVIRGSRK
jgi:tetraacyldisaccharide 4'-kinase